MTGPRPRVFIVLPTFLPHDAVGNDAHGMYECLRAAGYDATILAQSIHPLREPYTLRVDLESDATWSSPRNILIYHHALHWPLGEELLARTKTKVVFKYHNVTPPHFYENYSDYLHEACGDGIAATRRIVRRTTAWFWGDSTYNAQELIRYGAPPDRCHVLPPFHRIEDLAAAPLDNVSTGIYRQTGANVLFVGGLRPHKGHLKAVEVFAAFRRLSGAPSRLVLAGSSDASLQQYERDILAHAARLGVESDVDLKRDVSPSQLRAHYLTGSVFLCVSEHEGFCVPLVEAMYFRLPIIAWATTAVKETCGGTGMVFDDFQPRALAAAIDECVENPDLARQMAQRARSRYDAAFRPEAIRARLLDLFGEVERAA
jgi:glycosyltransferase involved in cell wall biosynthesis